MRFMSPYFLIMLAFSSLALAQSKDACNTSNLPSEIQTVLSEKYPGWHPKRLSDLEQQYDHKLWLESHAKECPGIAVGHFEQPGRLSYAVLLIQKIKTSESYKIIVLSRVSDQYAVRTLDQGNVSIELGSDSGLIISKEPPGTYSDLEEAKSINLKLDSINVEWLEKSSALYYWSHGKYQSMYTSD